MKVIARLAKIEAETKGLASAKIGMAPSSYPSILFIPSNLSKSRSKEYISNMPFFRAAGIPEEILEKLMKEGYYKTKTEAIRAAVIELGKKYGLIGSPAYYREQLQKIIKEKPFTEAEIKRELLDKLTAGSKLTKKDAAEISEKNKDNK